MIHIKMFDMLVKFNSQHILCCFRGVNRVRAKNRPKNPKGLDFTFNQEQAPQNFLQGDMRVDSEHHLIFFTTAIQHLGKNKTWYCNQTFKAVAKRFKQLYTIHVFIKQDDCVKQVPLIFILMSRMEKKII